MSSLHEKRADGGLSGAPGVLRYFDNVFAQVASLSPPLAANSFIQHEEGVVPERLHASMVCMHLHDDGKPRRVQRRLDRR